MKIYLILFLLCCDAFVAHAQKQTNSPSGTAGQTVVTVVCDHLTHDLLAQAKVELLRAADSTVVNTFTMGDDRQFNISVTQPGSYLLRVTEEGYIDRYVGFSFKKIKKKGTPIKLEPITLYQRPKN